jgi:N-acetylglucosaminyldiphosphoundecaprenol N-acetyl-beta-D-mannosaminyltransferase
MAAPCAKARIDVLGIPVDNLSMGEAVAAIVKRLNDHAPARVAFVNAHCVNVAARDPGYRGALAGADLVFADGVGMRLAGRLLGTRVRDNVNGTDLFPRLCQALEGTGHGLYLLGAAPGLAEQVARWAQARFPGLVVSGCWHGYFSEEQTPAVAERVRASGARVLLVAMGIPRQEMWIREHQAACGVTVAMGVGGLFDFFSGRIPRAPAWMRRWSLEWLFRLIQEPRRLWRRYLLGNWAFVGRVLAWRLFRRQRGRA